MAIKSNFKDGHIAKHGKNASTAGSEKGPGMPSAGSGSSSGMGVTVKQYESLPVKGSGVNSRYKDGRCR
jgi:hypothetical protein